MRLHKNIHIKGSRSDLAHWMFFCGLWVWSKKGDHKFLFLVLQKKIKLLLEERKVKNFLILCLLLWLCKKDRNKRGGTNKWNDWEVTQMRRLKATGKNHLEPASWEATQGRWKAVWTTKTPGESTCSQGAWRATLNTKLFFRFKKDWIDGHTFFT